jgi:hypothetical protein
MKNVIIKSMFVSLLVFSFTALFASDKTQPKQTKEIEPKVFAVINKADWCPTCQANGARIMSEVIPACKNLKVKFLPNDLTNDQTIAKSGEGLKKNKLAVAVQSVKSTGVILLIDAKTKKIIKEISVAKPSAEIIKEITLAQS